MNYFIKTILPALLIVLILHDVSSAGISHPKQADTAKKCAICHYRWVYTFFVEHRSTPLAPLQEEIAVGDPEMCLSCHDGSIKDSRNQICNDPGHRIGNKPSSNVSIPEKFPLDENGAMMCTTCHTPHAMTQGTGDDMVEFFLRAPNKNSSLCKACHVKALGGVEQGNHPVDISAESIPDNITYAGGKIGNKMPNQIICETCHIPHGGVNNNFLVLPNEDRNTRSVLCETCHTQKPGRSADEHLNVFSHPLDIKPGKAATIPAVWHNGEKVVRGTGGELVCRTCHKPHYATDKQYLLAGQRSKDHLCMQCHADQSAITGSTHDLQIAAPAEKNILGQKAAETGPCSSCHLVHSGVSRFMWARKPHTDASQPDFYCSSCHADGQCADKKQAGPYEHPMNIQVSDTAAPIPFPLYRDGFKQDSDGKITCMTCHDVHNPEPVYEDGPIKQGLFLRNGGKGLSYHCTTCHRGYDHIAGTDHDFSMKYSTCSSLTDTRIPSNRCAPCHRAHNNKQQELLWSAPLGAGFPDTWNKTYARNNDFMVGLCTGCHASGECAEQKTPQFALHPGNLHISGQSPETAMQIQTDLFPLFSPDGALSSTGNIVCSTCHNPHRWEGAEDSYGPGKEVDGTVLNSFLREDLAERFCSSCHGAEALFKLKYFHSRIGRKKEKEPFPFK